MLNKNYLFYHRGILKRRKEQFEHDYEVGKSFVGHDSKCYSLFREENIYKPERIKERITFKYNIVTRLIFLSVFVGIGGYLMYLLIKAFSIQSLLLLGTLILACVFIIYRDFKSPSRVVLDPQGIKIKGMVFLWRFIDDIYVKLVDNSLNDASNEDYLIILLKSGDYFEFDTSQVSLSDKKMRFYSEYFMNKTLTNNAL